MIDLPDFLSTLSAGGDLATMALLWVMWRFDRRLLVIETRVADEKETKP